MAGPEARGGVAGSVARPRVAGATTAAVGQSSVTHPVCHLRRPSANLRRTPNGSSDGVIAPAATPGPNEETQLLRDAIAVVLGLPAAVAGRFAPSGRRSSALRMTAVAAVVTLLTIAALDTTTSPITAFKTTPVDPHAAARMAATVETDFGVNDAVVIDFSTAMDPAAVEAATSIQPAAPTESTWSNGGKTLQIHPRGAWAPGQFYTVTVGTSAVDAAGTALTAPLRVIFFTRERPAAQIAATRATGNAAHPETEIAIRFSAPVETAAVAKAFSVEPPVDGTMTASAEPGEAGAERFIWTPTSPLGRGPDVRVPAGGDGRQRRRRRDLRAGLPQGQDLRPAEGRAQPARGWRHQDRPRPDHQRALLGAHGPARHPRCRPDQRPGHRQGRQDQLARERPGHAHRPEQRLQVRREGDHHGQRCRSVGGRRLDRRCRRHGRLQGDVHGRAQARRQGQGRAAAHRAPRSPSHPAGAVARPAHRGCRSRSTT